MDGQKTVADIVDALKTQYGEVDGLAEDVLEFFTGMVSQGWVKAHE
ncbi:MAG: PqqD family peptide modification chaperone [Granulosicoccaceae bacterium]